ncbi:hypothetical protein UVI_02039840 [Ustilaginoidea virens]|nr:hypothetical protein UVI_02039840 [Ustilaginoidea virens]
MEPVLAKIPYDATPEQFDEMRQDEKGPSREDGVMLIDKMTEFRRTSEAIYQANMTRLDSARAVLGDASGFEYISLFDIADMLLPGTLKTGQEFPAPALYAVHTALSRSEIGFNPMSPSADCHRRDHLFEVLPQSHAQTIARVAAWVGEYTDLSAKKLRPLKPGELEEIPLGRFIRQARDAVAHSRRSREWTPHGILKPSAGVTLPRVDWSPVSKEVIAFLEWWASYNLFDAGSRFHSYGALILRSLDLYREAALDQSTAWTFLQEIGVISPWEVPSRYKVRFPGSTIDRGGGISRSIPDDLEKSMRCDIAEGARKPVEGATVFCIDAPSTVIIDDGVSLERTSRPDEFWIHVHVADPASVIRPDSELAKFMELIPENIYLPGHFQAMLPPEVGQVGQDGQDGQDGAANSTSAAAGLVQRFSLQPGAPALTFSAKVNRAGDMLAYQVEPSTLRSVTYLDPEDVSSFCGEPPPPPVDGSYSFSVGTPPDETVAGTGAKRRRPMTRTRDLDEPSRADLLTLHGLCEAIRQKRLSRGAWPYFFPRPSVSVSFHEATPEGGACLGAAAALPPDPYIEVGAESSNGCSVVANAMVLAGQVAARWCWTRGIPIPYRRDSHSADDKLRQAALEYATRELYPLIRKGIEPSAGQRQALALLTGGIQISLEPGPYLLLGLDMYAKVTSPLRRFSDLLVHWQMHAALAHERRTAHAPSSDPAAAAAADSLDEVLPFSAAALGDSLPLLHTREKMARTVARGTVDWMLMALVRAWRFEGKAPRSLRFVVGSRWRQGLLGRLDMLGLDAIMDLAGLDGCRLIRDVQVGDEFEVHLADVNVHSQQILVKAIRYLGAARRPEAA